MKKYNLQVLASLIMAESQYKSNLDEKEVVILQSFMLVLRKENLLRINIEADNLSDFREKMETFVKSSENKILSKIYDDWVSPIIHKTRRHYLYTVVNTYANLPNDYLNDEGKELFDEQIQRYFNTSGKKYSDAFQPKELTELFNYFIDIDVVDYYNPFAGLASLSLNLPEHISYYGEELIDFNWMLGSLRMMMYECPEHYMLNNTDTFENWTSHKHEKYDHIAFNPPFNLKLNESYIGILNDTEFGSYRNANSLIISQCFKRLKADGQMVFLIPNGFLFSKQKNEFALKKYLVDNYHLKYVIALPSRILSFSGISVNMIILSKSRVEGTVFIDATSCFKQDNTKIHIINTEEVKRILYVKDSDLKKQIPTEKIISNDYDLSVHKYVFEELNLRREDEMHLQPLSKLVSAIPKKKSDVQQGIFLKIGDLSSDQIDYTKSFENLPLRDLRSDANLLPNHSLLLTLAYNNLKPTFYNGSNNVNVYYPYFNIFACKVNTEIVDVDYLIIELQKDYVRQQLDRIRTGTAISRIRAKELLSIEIIVPPIAEQKKKIYTFKDYIIQEKKLEVKDLMLSYGIDVADENSFLRHQIAGTLKNARNAFKALKQIIEYKVEPNFPNLFKLKLDDRMNVDFLNYMSILDRDLSSIHKSVNITGDTLELFELNVERFNLIKFITNYVQELENRSSNIFNIILNVDEEALKEAKIKEIFINGDKSLLRKMFDNIVENAEKHAFNNEISIKNRIQIELLYDFDNLEVQLDFGNSGKPLPEGYSWESFTRKGSKSGLNGGDGFGGWFINEVMKKHGGRFGFTDERGPEGIEGDIITSIELTFPIDIKI